ncbi:hypothetical protein KI387_039086 [Taxus chinensis]|uniref:Homeobox domain-containing protein n=1 Tax=Taxus chinensis TaxID=29808 RepID=A0AA38CB33_TAXCH|nr:hypothetical protein KI387_039086 [Taxus chinensis]
MKRTLAYSTSSFDTSYDESIAGEELDEYYNVGSLGEKKLKCKRLNMEQVRALEKSFELGKRVEPEKKMRLARALGLHPRQVSIWFQNRRARWKTKQLENDFGILKQEYDAFKALYLSLKEENNKLQVEIQRLNNMLKNDNQEMTGMDEQNFKENNEGICCSIELGLCPQHEGPVSSLEANPVQNVSTKLEENTVEEEEPCYYNLDEKSRFLWDYWL